MPEIYLYAEVLLNIRQVTLYASLRTTRNEHTKIEISSDKTIITVVHNGESALLYLPTQVAGNASVTIPSEKKKELSVRLEIEDVSKLQTSDLETITSSAPWPADDMSQETVLRCKSCDQIFVEAGVVEHWHDLPSENWYEMMDYWHCHQPHTETGGEAEPAQWNATSQSNDQFQRPRAKPRTGLVNAAHFLFMPEDCRGLKVSTKLLSVNAADICLFSKLLATRKSPWLQPLGTPAMVSDTLAADRYLYTLIAMSSSLSRWISHLKPVSP